MRRTRAVLSFLALLAPLLVPRALPGAPEMVPAVLAPLAPQSLLLDLAQVGKRLVTVGERGHILLSDDAGRSWRQVPAPTRSALTAVTFHDARRGLAVGHDAVVLLSEDGGEHWRLVHAAPEEEAPLLDVRFITPERALAIGAYAYLLHSEDGGESWTPGAVNDEDDFHLNHLAAAAGGEMLIAAEAGLLYHSGDGGESWDSLVSPYDGSFFGALLPAPADWLVFGLRGNLFRSRDGGANWRSIDTGTEAMLTDATRLADGRVVIVGLEGSVLLGAGESFTPYRLPGREGLSAVLALDDGTLIVAGEAGVRRLRLDELAPAQ